MSSQIIVGPILGFRGVKGGRWCTSALVVVQGHDPLPPQLTVIIGGRSKAEENAVLLKYRLTAPCGDWNGGCGKRRGSSW